MGTLSHHQAKAHEFLLRADRAITARDPAPAAVALRRAATHMTTSLAVHQGWKHRSQRQLETVLHVNIVDETLSRSHLKTLRQAHTLAANLSPNGTQQPVGATHASPPVLPQHNAVRPTRTTTPAHGEQPQVRLRRIEPQAIHSIKPNHPVNPADLCKTTIRRMRRRVASLINHTLLLIAGKPKPVQHHKLWLRRPDFPAVPDFTCIQDILQLPNYQEIRQKFRLHRAPLSAEPDPHGWYQRGDAPRRCRCHAELWDKPRDPRRITLSPLWQRALEKTFRIRLPDALTLTC